MTVRARLVFAAGMLAATFLMSATADAQGVRVAVRRPGVIGRPTIFVGGFYYPRLYRASLYYGPFRPYYYGGFYGAPYYAQWPPYGYARYDLSGTVRLQVSPKDTEVFIDGYYAGRVDDFDGIFQRLHVEAGEHEIELYLPGHRPFQQRVYLQPDRTFRIRHTMEPLAPGEAEPARPAGAPLSPPGSRDPRAGPPPRDPRSAPAARAQGFGQLSLRVQPADADVIIDGERWDGSRQDERLVVELGAGVHRLEIRRDGYRSYFTDVTIREGDSRLLNVALTKS